VAAALANRDNDDPRSYDADRDGHGDPGAATPSPSQGIGLRLLRRLARSKSEGGIRREHRPTDGLALTGIARQGRHVCLYLSVSGTSA
jgi:two-component sensor histidine kinase